MRTLSMHTRPFQKEDHVIIKKSLIPVRETVVGIYNEVTQEMRLAKATCSPKDQFKRKLGTKIACDRAAIKPLRTVTVIDPKKVSEVFLEAAKELLKPQPQIVYENYQYGKKVR